MSRYSVILGNLGNTCDRFLSTGYKEQPPKAEMIRQAAAIQGVKGVELVGTWDVTRENVDEIGGLLAKHGLPASRSSPTTSRRSAGEGAHSSRRIPRSGRRPLTRRTSPPSWPGSWAAPSSISGQARTATTIRSSPTTITERRWTIEAVNTAAKAFPDIRFSLEYKPKEPRTHSTWARAADTLLVARETGLPNVGVTIDTGHSFVAGENMAEAAVILSRFRRTSSSTSTSTTITAPGTTT